MRQQVLWSYVCHSGIDLVLCWSGFVSSNCIVHSLWVGPEDLLLNLLMRQQVLRFYVVWSLIWYCVGLGFLPLNLYWLFSLGWTGGPVVEPLDDAAGT